MTNVSISEITQEITSASELDGNELFLISDVNDSTYTSKKCNLGNIKNYVGTTINNQEKTVSPSTSSQNVTPDTGYTGLSKVTVNAISTETKTATPSTTAQDITPTSGKYLTKVTVNAISAGNPSAITPTSFPITVSPASGKTYMTSATVNAPANLSAGNIKSGVSIAGVSGTYNGTRGTVNPSSTQSTQSVFRLYTTKLLVSLTTTTPSSINYTISDCDINVYYMSSYYGTGDYTVNDSQIANCNVNIYNIPDLFSSFELSSDKTNLLIVNQSHTWTIPASVVGTSKLMFDGKGTFTSNGSTWTKS